MKALLPNLKEKKHYIVFDIISEKTLNKKDIEEAIYKTCQNFIGNFNSSKAGVNILPELCNHKKGILKVNNKYSDHVKTSLMMIKNINGKKAIVKTIGTTGILKKAKEKYLNKGG